MQRPLFKREFVIAPGVVGHSCLLFQIRWPLLRHCYILRCDHLGPEAAPQPSRPPEFFISQAERLATERVGDRYAFTLIHKLTTSQKKTGWQVQIFVIHKLWGKGWTYWQWRRRSEPATETLQTSPSKQEIPSSLSCIASLRSSSPPEFMELQSLEATTILTQGGDGFA